jgi:hypothetical protein
LLKRKAEIPTPFYKKKLDIQPFFGMLWKNGRPEDAAICAWLRENGVGDP